MEEFKENELHLRDYLRILRKRKGLFLTVASIAFLVAVLSAYSRTPLYTASTQVLIDKNLDVGRIEGAGAYAAFDPNFQATQFELIRSFNVALRTVKNLQLDSKYRHYFLKEEAAAADDSSSSWTAAAWETVSTFFSDASVYLATLISPELNEEKQVSGGAEADISSEPQNDAEKIAEMIQRGIKVAPLRNTKIANVFYTHEHPEVSRLIADALVQAYIDESLDIKTSTARHTLQWMNSKAEEEQKKLEASERALQQYMRENDIVTVENKLAVLPERLSSFSKELAEAQAKEKEFQAIYNQIGQAGKNYNTLETLPVFADSPVLRDLRTKLLTSEQNIRELSEKYGEKNPIMKKAVEDRQVLLAEKRSEIERIIAATKNGYELAKAKVRDINEMINETKAEMLNINEHFVQYTILSRDKEMNRTVYDALASSIKKTDVTAQSMDVKIWAVKKAELPQFPSKPNKPLTMLVGLLVGLIGGAGLVFFLDYLDNTVGSGKDIEERYSLTVLGTVEDMSGRRYKKHNIETYIQDNPLSPAAESYRLIRSGLMLSTPEHPPRTMLITSMVQQEGKSTTTKNLALILAQNEKKVLIVDCDMRRPRQHSMFGVVNTYGLSNYLSGNTDEKQTLIRQVPDSPLYLITSGPVPPNPAELLNSAKMAQLVKETQEQFDFVLLDSPPVQQVTDSLSLGPLADGTVLVVRAGKTTYEMLDSGVKRLRESHAHLLGIVLNRLTKKHADKGYYGYYSYYSHYGYSSKKDHYTKEGKPA
jgi:capsular exopolysaccharide synthesis family protein